MKFRLCQSNPDKLSSKPAGSTTGVYLLLAGIDYEPKGETKLYGAPVVLEIERLLSLPRLAELQSIPRRALALRFRVVTADPGCFWTRSNGLLALLGFGNARLAVHMVVTDANTKMQLFEKRQTLRHSGGNRLWDDYLQDNSAELLKELAAKCAYKLMKSLRAALLRSQRLTGNFQPEG